MRLDRIYVMDNHRLAPWCFWQHEDEAASWRVFHIDRHPDAADDNINWPKARAAFQGSLEAYRAATRGGYPLFVWDSIMRAVAEASPGRLTDFYMAASDAREKIPDFVTDRYDPWHLEPHLRYIVHQNEEGDDISPWWIDLDLDYFVSHEGETLMDTQFVRRIGELIFTGIRNGRIRLVTVALSPETSGGWPTAESLLLDLIADWPHEFQLRLPPRDGNS